MHPFSESSKYKETEKNNAFVNEMTWMSAHGHGQKLMKAKKHTLMTSLQVIQHRPLAIRSRNTQHQQTVIGYTPIKKNEKSNTANCWSSYCMYIHTNIVNRSNNCQRLSTHVIRITCLLTSARYSWIQPRTKAKASKAIRRFPWKQQCQFG